MRVLSLTALAAGAAILATPASAAVSFLGSRAYIAPTAELGRPFSDPFDTVQQVVDDLAEGAVMGDILASQTIALTYMRESQLLGEIAGEYFASVAFTDAAHGQMVAEGSSAVDVYGADAYGYTMFHHDVGYGFSVDRASVLDLSYVNGVHATLHHSTDGMIWNALFIGTGAQSFDLHAGGTYFLDFSGSEGLNNKQEGPGSTSGLVRREFNFSITDSVVPEPAAWALMIVGFGLAGSALRRRSTARA